MSGKESIPPFSALSQLVRLGQYRHYSGGLYDVIALAREEADLSEVVIYRSVTESENVWVRPLADFVATIEKDGTMIQRFEYCGE